MTITVIVESKEQTTEAAAFRMELMQACGDKKKVSITIGTRTFTAGVSSCNLQLGTGEQFGKFTLDATKPDPLPVPPK